MRSARFGASANKEWPPSLSVATEAPRYDPWDTLARRREPIESSPATNKRRDAGSGTAAFVLPPELLPIISPKFARQVLYPSGVPSFLRQMT